MCFDPVPRADTSFTSKSYGSIEDDADRREEDLSRKNAFFFDSFFENVFVADRKNEPRRVAR